jgi:hypothetical protein
MKKLALTVASMLVAVYAYGQGTVLFDTSIGYPDAIVTYADSGDPAAGPDAVGQLYGGLDMNSLAPQGVPVEFGLEADGLAGWIITGGVVTVDNAAAGTAGYYVQLRAWNTAAPGLVGESPALQLTLGGGTLPPADLTGLGPTVIPVPEPSVIALGLLGAAALLIRRRK